MTNEECKKLARRLAVNGIEQYRKRFMVEVDLLSGVDREKVIQEMGNIIEEVKHNKAENYKRAYEDTKRRLDHIASLDDCDEEFEM